jgi:hypothetical protein
VDKSGALEGGCNVRVFESRNALVIKWALLIYFVCAETWVQLTASMPRSTSQFLFCSQL